MDTSQIIPLNPFVFLICILATSRRYAEKVVKAVVTKDQINLWNYLQPNFLKILFDLCVYILAVRQWLGSVY